MITGTLRNHSSLPDTEGQLQMFFLAFSKKPVQASFFSPSSFDHARLAGLSQQSLTLPNVTALLFCLFVLFKFLSSVTFPQNSGAVVEGSLPARHHGALHGLKHHPPCGAGMKGWRGI